MAGRSSKRLDGPRGSLAAAGAMGLVALCCGGHVLVLGALGGLALGTTLGIGAGVLTAVVSVTALVVIRRRRAVTCERKAEHRVGS